MEKRDEEECWFCGQDNQICPRCRYNHRWNLLPELVGARWSLANINGHSWGLPRIFAAWRFYLRDKEEIVFIIRATQTGPPLSFLNIQRLTYFYG